MSYNDRSAQYKPGYFRQYRIPGKGASRKNGLYGHPNLIITGKDVLVIFI